MSDCPKCHDSFYIEPDLDPTKFCNLCAQNIVERLLEITPEPPNAITYEQGVDILNAVQSELYPPRIL